MKRGAPEEPEEPEPELFLGVPLVPVEGLPPSWGLVGINLDALVFETGSIIYLSGNPLADRITGSPPEPPQS